MGVSIPCLLADGASLEKHRYACQGHHGLSQQPVQGCSCRRGRVGAGSGGGGGDWGTSSRFLRPGSKLCSPLIGSEWAIRLLSVLWAGCLLAGRFLPCSFLESVLIRG